MKNIAVSLILVSLFALSGCGSNESLSGKVSFEDGKPLDQGTVCFLKEGFMARGTIGPDGSYVVGSVESDDGLPPGIYQVYIEGAVIEDLQSPTGVTAIIDPKMTSPQTSGLTCEVPVENDVLNITVGYPQ
jgi:hypothetical protein